MLLASLVKLFVPLSVFCNVFALALEAGPADVLFLLRRPALLLRSILAMYGIMVAFALAAAWFLGLGRTVNTALIALALSPVPPALPIQSRNTGGSRAYAIGLLVAAVLVALVLVPAWVGLISYAFNIDAHITAAEIAPVVTITVLAPVFAGVLVNHVAPGLAARLVRPFARGATVLLLIAMLIILVLLAEPLWAALSAKLVLALSGFILAGLAVGHLLGGAAPRERAILALATAARHPGVAITIITAVFPAMRTTAMIVVIWYMLLLLVFVVPYVLWQRRRNPLMF